MSCIVSKVSISDVVRANDQAQVSAMVVLEFVLAESGEVLVPGKMKHDVCVNIRPGAPERRIMRRLRSEAINRQQTYFDGIDEQCPNIFADLSEVSDTTLSINDEIELEQELLAIEHEFQSAA